MYQITHPITKEKLYEASSCGIGWLATLKGEATRKLVELGLRAAACLDHRGAKSADGLTADGAGIMTDIPRDFLAKVVPATADVPEGDLGVAVFFLPVERGEQNMARRIIESVLEARRLPVLGWRPVPIFPSVLGRQAQDSMPNIRQLFVRRPENVAAMDFETYLYHTRKEIERKAGEGGIDPVYAASFSSRTLVYKGMVAVGHLADFFRDLQDPDYKSRAVMYHQRFSTNTWPDWLRAQPFRFLAHNGEINTLQGNVNWSKARECELPAQMTPLIQNWGSDSTKLDNVLEATVYSGCSPAEALLRMVPEAHEKNALLSEEQHNFYEYNAALAEPWDGPAGVVYYDGKTAIAHLDRNGLRPIRVLQTEEYLLVSSEAGVLDVPDEKIVHRDQLGAGDILAVNVETGEVLEDSVLKQQSATRRNWAEMTAGKIVEGQCSNEAPRAWDLGHLMPYQIASGMSHEDVGRIFAAMFEGKEPVGSMGDDTPITVLSEKPRTLYWYFRQLFAQVTNPPIDSLREGIVFSLTTYLGDRSGYWNGELSDRVIRLKSPVLFDQQTAWLEGLERTQVIDTLFNPMEGGEALAGALSGVARQAEEAVRSGRNILILTDRNMGPDKAAIPMMIAVSCVHHHLLSQGLRMKTGIVAQTGSVWQDHHLACCLGYGANAVNPWLALATTRANNQEESNYVKALEKGLYKIMAKMGVSPVTSYIGAQLFEAVGIEQDVLDQYFPGTHGWLNGATLEDIGNEALIFHSEAYGEDTTKLPDRGEYRHRQQGQQHRYSPEVVKLLQDAVGLVRGPKQEFHQTKPGGQESYDKFADLWKSKPPAAIRDLLEFKATGPAVPVEKVEPVEAITARFVGAAMSHGALSIEAHETVAIGMNQVGAKSNSGEGGESPERYGTIRRSKIKQVASARFGVTPHYLIDASELQIKMAQGSKPGEGGQIPGMKVSEEIAELRHSQPGIDLISPPPLHDIYSIEDLAQLIYDLKVVNPKAAINVKLVSEVGVGTIAAGVAKAGADIIHISGHSGGTGASPWGSIKHAGLPWELGIWDTHRVLTLNGLRDRVTLVTDGGMQTGRDIIAAAMLGAEEFAFGTALLVAISCVMARQCHLNTCPVGITSQDPKFRAKYPGKPEHVVRYLTFMAEEVRHILASLGVRTIEEIIGRSDMLEVRKDLEWRAARVDVRDILAEPYPLRPKTRQPEIDIPLDDTIIQQGALAIGGERSVTLSLPVKNTDRTVGARVSGEIARRYGNQGLPAGKELVVKLEGSAGQSFGFACIEGLKLCLKGEANDYVGKSAAGGVIAIRPPDSLAEKASENSIIGNVALYGATGGKLFVAGRAGQRFAVRNSGAIAVVEGATKHCCEYMTGGTVVILGQVGDNFGAGMTGGAAYLTDITPEQINDEYVRIEEAGEEDMVLIKQLLDEHVRNTGSVKASGMLAEWESWKTKFLKVAPKSVARLIEQQAAEEMSQPSIR